MLTCGDDCVSGESYDCMCSHVVMTVLVVRAVGRVQEGLCGTQCTCFWDCAISVVAHGQCFLKQRARKHTTTCMWTVRSRRYNTCTKCFITCLSIVIETCHSPTCQYNTIHVNIGES